MRRGRLSCRAEHHFALGLRRGRPISSGCGSFAAWKGRWLVTPDGWASYGLARLDLFDLPAHFHSIQPAFGRRIDSWASWMAWLPGRLPSCS